MTFPPSSPMGPKKKNIMTNKHIVKQVKVLLWQESNTNVLISNGLKCKQHCCYHLLPTMVFFLMADFQCTKISREHKNNNTSLCNEIVSHKLWIETSYYSFLAIPNSSLLCLLIALWNPNWSTCSCEDQKKRCKLWFMIYDKCMH